MTRQKKQAFGYLRTSSSTNTGPDKECDKRQRAAIAAFAKAHGYIIVEEFYDAAVSGADPINERPGFKAMLDRIAGDGVRCIIVESPDRFARDLTVQLTGHDFLKSIGVALVPATAPDFFTEDTPTAVLVRQVLGAIAQFEKTSLVAKLKPARDRKRAEIGKCGGRKSYAEARPETVALAKELKKQSPAYHFARFPLLFATKATQRALGSRTARVRSNQCWAEAEFRLSSGHFRVIARRSVNVRFWG